MVRTSEEQKEDVFQAILLADNFQNSIFGTSWADKRSPGADDFENEREKETNGSNDSVVDLGVALECMTPLVNRRLLDYALESLTVSGVQEIFIFCSSGKDGSNIIKEHIRSSKWDELSVKIQVISSETCGSVGDALRDIDAQGIIRNDFIIMNIGTITNVALKPLLEEHRTVLKADKGAVMTIVRRKVPSLHRARSSNENTALVIDSSSRKIIGYSQKLSGRALKIPKENLRTEMDIILDTIDTGITVCSSSVLPLFTDNFDFTDMTDFIKNILINEEVMGNTIYYKEICSGYSSKVLDYDSFMGISLDIVHRWSYPLVPDMPFGSYSKDDVYTMSLNFVYKGPNVLAARDAKLGPDVVIGNKTVVGKNTAIRNCCIGTNCTIEDNCVLSNCQLGNNVKIESGCKISKCVILDNSIVTRGTASNSMSLFCGNDVIPIEQGEFLEDSDESDEEGVDDRVDGLHDLADEDEVNHQERDFKRFCDEVMESLHRGFTDNVALDNLFLEIQGSRTANFMYFDDATVAVIKAILGLAPKLHDSFLALSVLEQWETTNQVVVKFRDLLVQYVKTDTAQMHVLKSIEEYANDNEYFRPMLMRILHYYYNEDILTQDPILNWYKNKSLYEAGTIIRESVAKFIEWLETASEESEDESDSDE